MPTALEDAREVETVQSPPPALDYDRRGPAISHRQFSIFLILIFINTLLFAWFVFVPQGSPMLKEWWAAYQHRRELREYERLRKTLVDNCLQHSMPADMLVYAESATDAHALLSSAGRSATIGVMTDRRGQGIMPPENFQPGAMRLDPDVLAAAASVLSLESGNRTEGRNGGSGGISLFAQAPKSEVGTIYFGPMTTPSGAKRLVWVGIEAVHHFDQVREGYQYQLRRRLTSIVLDPANSDKRVRTAIAIAPVGVSVKAVRNEETGDSSMEMPPPQAKWKLFAGQVDSKDASRVSIKLDIDGQPTEIEGKLNDEGRLMLTPKVGKLVRWTSGEEYEWEMVQQR